MRSKVAFLLLRIGIGIVFLVFGIGKFQNDIWAQTIKNTDFFLRLPWGVNSSIFLIGALEIITGAALIVGLFTRFFALLATLELAAILVLLKFQETRDIGLLAATGYLTFAESDSWGIDLLLKRRRN